MRPETIQDGGNRGGYKSRSADEDGGIGQCMRVGIEAGIKIDRSTKVDDKYKTGERE